MDDYDAMMATNVRSVVELTQHAIPHLIESKGCIVNVSSTLSIMAAQGALAYSMSKAALDHFTKCVAMELASKGVRVNSVNPAIDRDKLDLLEQFRVNYPPQRIGHIDDCVNAIAFFANENASFVTGVILPVGHLGHFAN